MDSGEEIPGLNEDWNFLGANAVEWSSGLAMFLVVGQLLFQAQVATHMPFLLLVWIGTTVGLSRFRQQFPDEHRGVRNSIMTMCGFEPPDIPTPSALQQFWSGAPVRELNAKSDFCRLGLEKIFPTFELENEKEERRAEKDRVGAGF